MRNPIWAVTPWMRRQDGITEKLDFNFDGKERNDHWRSAAITNKVDIKLNPKVDWKLDMNVGACSPDFDLSQFAISSADMKAGALFDENPTWATNPIRRDFRINAGVSSITIYVPKDCGMPDQR